MYAFTYLAVSGHFIQMDARVGLGQYEISKALKESSDKTAREMELLKRSIDEFNRCPECQRGVEVARRLERFSGTE